ncbi:MAG: sel1 repeat family protein [Acidobacteria bacterium]|nr:sel1 repeat family protein [Acidobacteriota bacterium]
MLVLLCLAGATTARGQRKTNPTLEELTAAAEGGDADAQYKLGMQYYSEGGPRHPGKYFEALKWFQLAAAQGNAQAEDRIGVMYYFRQGVPKDYAEAAHWYQLAGEKGISHAQWQLVDMYSRGLGVPRDMAESKRWARLGKRPENGGCAGYVVEGLLFVPDAPTLSYSGRSYWDLEGDLRRTMSAVRVPRAMAKVLPSPDQSMLLIWSEVKWVSCFGGPPVRGWRQTSEMPPRVTA